MKRQYFQKALAVALAVSMTAALAGCGKENAPAASKTEGGADKKAEAQAAETAGEIQEVEVDWYSCVTGWGPASWQTDSSPLMDAIREKTGVSFRIEQPPTDAETKLGLMIASDDLPDLISLTADTDTISQLIESGKVWKMEEFLQTYDPDSHLLTDFPQDIKETVIYKFGDWYAWPSHLESADMRKVYPITAQALLDNVTKGHNAAIMFNKTIMDELGITREDVQTEAGFYEACKKVKNSGYTVNGQEVLPVVLHANLWIRSSLDTIIAENFGAVPVDEEGNYRHLELDPGYKNGLKFVNTLIRNGCLDVNTLTIDEAALKTYVEGGRVFCWIGNPAQSTKKETIPLVSFGPIVAENGAKPVAPINLAAGSGWIQTFVSKDCEHPEQIAKMLSFATSKEGTTLNEYGVEGEDFIYDEHGVAVRTEEGQKRYEEVFDKNIALWPFANTDFAWSTQPEPAEGTDSACYSQISTAIGKWEDTYIYNSELFAFKNGSVVEPSSDMGIKISQVENYLESQKAKVVSAPSEEAFEKEYQNMITTLEGYHIEEIDAVYNEFLQKSYDRYGDRVENVNAHLYQ